MLRKEVFASTAQSWTLEILLLTKSKQLFEDLIRARGRADLINLIICTTLDFNARRLVHLYTDSKWWSAWVQLGGDALATSHSIAMQCIITHFDVFSLHRLYIVCIWWVFFASFIWHFNILWSRSVLIFTRRSHKCNNDQNGLAHLM